MTRIMPPHMRSARTVELLEVVVCEGHGTVEDVTREVTYYFTPDGALVARNDPGPAASEMLRRDAATEAERIRKFNEPHR